MDVITCTDYFTVLYTYMDILVCVHVEYENIGHEKRPLGDEKDWFSDGRYYDLTN